MATDPQFTPFSLLPDSRPPWKEFTFSMVTQAAGIALLLWVGLLYPRVLPGPSGDYKAVVLVSTPPPVNHEPAPIREFKLPEPVANLDTPIPENLRLPAPTPKPRTPLVEETQAPKSRDRCQQTQSAPKCSGDSETPGPNQRLLHGKLGHANDGSRSAECANWRLRRSQRSAGKRKQQWQTGDHRATRILRPTGRSGIRKWYWWR